MKEKKPLWKRLLTAGGTLLSTMLLLLLYELSVRYVWQAVFWVYFALLSAGALFVVIYNRGFSRSFIRRAELPKTWSEAQKDAFFADAQRRLRHTAPLVSFLLLPLCLTFAFDILCLFLWEPLSALLPFLN